MCVFGGKGVPTIFISRDRAVVVVSGEVSHFINREAEVQKWAMSGLRPHSKSMAELGPEPRTLAFQCVCLSLALQCSSLNTHSSTFRSRESHHASLTTGTRGAWRSRATILTSRTLRMKRTKAEVRTEGGQSEEWEGAQEQRYLQGGQFCHQDQGCQGFRSDPKGKQRGVGEVEEKGDGGEGRRVEAGVGDTPEGRSVVLLQSTSSQTPDGTGRVLGQAGQRAGVSPWHQAGQLHRGDQLHQENLWGQQGQENHVHQRDPGWQGGSHRDD